jgi:hypothetical protein
MIRIDGLGHGWTRKEVDTTVVMWQFFKSHRLNRQATSPEDSVRSPGVVDHEAPGTVRLTTQNISVTAC